MFDLVSCHLLINFASELRFTFTLPLFRFVCRNCGLEALTAKVNPDAALPRVRTNGIQRTHRSIMITSCRSNMRFHIVRLSFGIKEFERIKYLLFAQISCQKINFGSEVLFDLGHG